MVASFQAFIDESTSDEEFVLAGHISTAEKWATFAGQWEELLPFGTKNKDGNYQFKMSAMALVPERMARVPNFYKIIEENVISSISCRINLRDFEVAQERLAFLATRMNWTVNLGPWTNPYFFTYRLLMDKFHAERKTFQSKFPLDNQVDFIFDERTEKKMIIRGWDEYIEKRPDEIRSHYGSAPRFENDQKFLPLQAADLWAWWVREWYEEDSDPVPDRLRDMDFGNWRGKKRPNIIISATEDGIVDVLQSVVADEFASGNYRLTTSEGPQAA